MMMMMMKNLHYPTYIKVEFSDKHLQTFLGGEHERWKGSEQGVVCQVEELHEGEEQNEKHDGEREKRRGGVFERRSEQRHDFVETQQLDEFHCRPEYQQAEHVQQHLVSLYGSPQYRPWPSIVETIRNHANRPAGM